MDFNLENARCSINKRLTELVPASEALYKTLFSATRYSLNAPGKRLRPLLTLAVVNTFADSFDHALTPAAALEMIHTYSLIHDDLPCMDNDDFRRGLPTLHKVYPEAIALLAGDFLLTRAFEVIANCEEISSPQKLQLITILSSCAGGDGMIGGQVLDIESEKTEIDLPTLECLHSKKTGALLAASAAFGGILANVSNETQSLLYDYGLQFGLAFQIADDLLDVTHSMAKHGRAHSSDVANNKSTYVSILGLEKTRTILHKQIEKTKKILLDLPKNPKILLEFTDMAITIPAQD